MKTYIKLLCSVQITNGRNVKALTNLDLESLRYKGDFKNNS